MLYFHSPNGTAIVPISVTHNRHNARSPEKSPIIPTSPFYDMAPVHRTRPQLPSNYSHKFSKQPVIDTIMPVRRLETSRLGVIRNVKSEGGGSILFGKAGRP
ncbi:hypothetical protein K443DRAFT_685527 [Laccaria amethystina LaAM-08-1]|uniref:Uncharacterized protein n=1 Tax=Laccaria amethystina LaAM-08-1 TaxID=1095629 RepID=A0A0C9WNK3_9AGAR|nr:hypothetical protein K443DRAFT_685527 [Laccaria amethystina LaAM-08-1]